jgi:hypothetical protein
MVHDPAVSNTRLRTPASRLKNARGSQMPPLFFHIKEESSTFDSEGVEFPGGALIR